MEFPLGALIFWVVIFGLLGIGVGSFIERRFIKHPNRVEPPPAQAQQALPQQQTGYGLNRTGDLSILRAWRTRAGKLWLEMDGKRLDDKYALTPEQVHRLTTLLTDLKPWVEITAPPAVKAAPAGAQPAKAAAPAAKEAPATPVGMKSIIEQINDVLQVKVASTVYKSRGIQIFEGAGGMVMVQDGLKKYEGIESVPDPEIQALIRQAVSDWEKNAR
jgi:hypothetical protein